MPTTSVSGLSQSGSSIFPAGEMELGSRFTLALGAGKIEHAEALLQEEGQLTPDELGHALLFVSSMKMDPQVKIRAFELLEMQGVDFDSIDGDSRTSLHHVARLGELEPFRWLLLQQGVDQTKQDRWGYTALHEAADCRYLSPEAIEAWVVAGGGLDAVTNKNETALTIACKKCQFALARALFDYGAAIGIQDDQGYAEVSYALRLGVPDANPGPYGQFKVPEHNQLALEMIQTMDDVNQPIAPGQTPLLHVARCKRINDLAHPVNLTAHLNALLDRGARISAVDPLGDTIFHIGAKRGDQHLFECVLPQIDWDVYDEPDPDPADVINSENENGMTPVQIADERGHPGIIDLLVQRGAPSPEAVSAEEIQKVPE